MPQRLVLLSQQKEMGVREHELTAVLDVGPEHRHVFAEACKACEIYSHTPQ